MTTTTAYGRLAETAVAARGGADLERFTLSDRIPADRLAKNGDGSYTITGMDVLKTGVFNGVVEIIDADLDGMVARFEELRDGGIFVPPFRLDHGWSVLDVIGYYETLETYTRDDPTTGVVRRFMRGDVRITGSLDHDPAKIVAAIKRGALRTRSSELGFYVTNAGVELPRIFYGCAFVDIPAVEGLEPVKLSRRPEPRRITNLSDTPPPEGTPSMDPENLARLAALRVLNAEAADGLGSEDAAELAALEAEASEAGVTDEEVEAARVPDPEGDPNGEPAGDTRIPTSTRTRPGRPRRPHLPRRTTRLPRRRRTPPRPTSARRPASSPGSAPTSPASAPRRPSGASRPTGPAARSSRATRRPRSRSSGTPTPRSSGTPAPSSTTSQPGSSSTCRVARRACPRVRRPAPPATR